MKHKNTTFFWFTERSPGDGPRREAAPGTCRRSAPIDVVPGTPAALLVAEREILGRQVVRTAEVDLGAGPLAVRYIERTLPMTWPGPVPEGGVPLYASALTQGAGIGVASEGPEGTEYDRYRYVLTAVARPYRLKTDKEVAALAGTALDSWPDEGSWLAFEGIDRTRFISRRVMPSTRSWTVPGGLMKYTDDATSVGVPYNYPEAGGTIRYKWWQVPYPSGFPMKAISKALQCVNDAAFDDFPAGTLLFDSFDHTDPEPGPLGDLLTDVTYQLRYLPRRTRAGASLGWNALKRRSTFEYVIVSTDGTLAGVRLHQTADFSTLFRPDPP